MSQINGGFLLFFGNLIITFFKISWLNCARPGLGTQPRYEAPGDLRVKNVENTVINIG